MDSVNDIRRAFLDFFVRNGHQAVESSPLVPRNDPTLMFTNAGMVQFKNVFTGLEQRPYSRAASSQKCVRAGGKHNDLENVGYTARHHTFFEMLGNFSFGDYFKETAIDLAWRLVTAEFGLDPARLLVTVYHEDDEAADLWRRIAGLDERRIIRIATSDNFWSMGDTGPCGPCSEIFYDHGPGIAGGPPGSPDADGDRFIEIWNLVFMQFEQMADGSRVPLPRPSIDTGMGLERVAAVLQGVHDNYDTDLMRGLVEVSASLTATAPDQVSHRVIADHLRASAFLMADGVTPSNEGRGYVLRRIMRRAMRHAHLLGAREPLMFRLVPALVAEMGQAYPELLRAQPLIVAGLKLEETRFKQTLERGLKLLEDELASLPDGADLPGQTAFRLYDTFGFPLDLTQDILRGRGRGIEQPGFDAAMQRQRETARRAWAGSGESAEGRIWLELADRLPATEFLGYETEVAEGQVLALVGDGQALTEAGAGTDVQIVLNQTPFYGESGGQVGDRGRISGADGLLIAVEETRKVGGRLFVHHGRVTAGTLRVGMAVDLAVDAERRGAIRANHSATHLLHEALRQRLGSHVAQRGSLVAPERLRFDISQPTPLAAEDIHAVEAEVNARIRGNSAVTTRLMSPEDAIAEGAMALFGEKYGEEVRVVSMGGIDRGASRDWSIELCGGTHVSRTGDIGAFRITGESAVAAGIRRIEAVTGPEALAWSVRREALLTEAAGMLRAPPEDLPARLAALLEERKRLERELADARRKAALDTLLVKLDAFNDRDMAETRSRMVAEENARDNRGGAGGGEPHLVGGIPFVALTVEDLPAKELKPLIDTLKPRLGGGVLAIAATAEGKLALSVSVSPELTARVSAVNLVRAGAEAAGGRGGGGRPELAQAGGPDAARAGEALAAIESALAAAVA